MKKIIVADDEELLRNLVCDYLTREGYQPIPAMDGEEALSLFNENPDTVLLILDIMMPNIDGWEVCRKIRETSSVPIIMLTARNQEFDELTGFDAGADDYVTKPCSPSVLMKRVAALLKRENAINNSNVFTMKYDWDAYTIIDNVCREIISSENGSTIDPTKINVTIIK